MECQVALALVVKIPSRISVGNGVPSRFSVGSKIPSRISVGNGVPSRFSVGSKNTKSHQRWQWRAKSPSARLILQYRTFNAQPELEYGSRPGGSPPVPKMKKLRTTRSRTTRQQEGRFSSLPYLNLAIRPRGLYNAGCHVFINLPYLKYGRVGYIRRAGTVIRSLGSRLPRRTDLIVEFGG
ncbi:hypothetical protein ACJJTC_008081 [Scirpophaga incertulas]